MQLCGSLSILWHCLSLGLEWKLTFSSPVATAEFSKFAGVLRLIEAGCGFKLGLDLLRKVLIFPGPVGYPSGFSHGAAWLQWVSLLTKYTSHSKLLREWCLLMSHWLKFKRLESPICLQEEEIQVLRVKWLESQMQRQVSNLWVWWSPYAVLVIHRNVFCFPVRG